MSWVIHRAVSGQYQWHTVWDRYSGNTTASISKAVQCHLIKLGNEKITCTFICMKHLSLWSTTNLYTASSSYILYVVVWHSGSVLVSIYQVNLHWARLLPGWVTMCRFNFWCGTFISVCNQPPRPTQPGHHFMGRRNEYQPKGVTPCGWGVKASIWFVCGRQVKLCDPLSHAGHIWVLSRCSPLHDKALYKFTLHYLTLWRWYTQLITQIRKSETKKSRSMHTDN